MSFLRGSANYVWCTTSVLGKGATGAVFQGVNKNNGEPVAVKTFNQLSYMRAHNVQVREFEVLKKVKHENIVKLLAIEEEQDSKGKVIVMELCTGGSLFNILDDPENTYGLQEEEFLLVLEHLSAGMKHLRDNNLVHRDLKPGNIMKFICDDGTTVYKLTDFGAARELQEDQQFMSLYGTEEYLHPDLFERAVLRKTVGTGKTFGATVDLWSIGVTLYHVATGKLPFRPYGGRRNKETMYFITTKKASGVISGSQSIENGPIEWSKDLPTNCQLSTGLKKLVTPLLAGLLEVDSQRIWSFERFFSEVTSILSCKLIHIFYINKVQNIRIYLHPDETYLELQCLVQEQTDVAATNQILIYQDSELLSVVENTTPGHGYPTTQEDKPLMLFSIENNNVSLASDEDVPKFPTFPTLVSVEKDANLAKEACSEGHACKRRVEKLSRSSLLTHACVEQFIALVSKDLENIEMKSQKLQDVTRCVEEMKEAILRGRSTLHKLSKSLGTGNRQIAIDNEDISSMSTPSSKFINDLAPLIQQQYQQWVTENALHREWLSSTRCLPCPAKLHAPARARSMVDRLRDSWQHLLRDRATRSLTYNDEQFHVLERIKVGETGRRIQALLDAECQPAVAQLADCLADWYKKAQTVYVKVRIFDRDINEYEARLNTFAHHLSEADITFHQKLQDALGQTKQDAKPKATPSKPINKVRRNTNEFHQCVNNIIAVQGEMATIMRENSEIVSQFQQLTMNFVGDGGEEK
ncbi:Serine/threonine-protein kinase TBK1 [Blattella germanica]|nr:Serine/threonine-protein kinase TBK1 [Blattella germanica]